MWCRALLIAAIITCTFSQITVPAHAQGTQRLVQIKDLICVLLLSGLQKEDLDVNTLKKLHRYNVHLDNLTYDKSHQECLSKDTLYIADEPKPDVIYNQNESSIINHTESPISPTLQTVSKYFVELQKSHNVSSQNKTENVLFSDPRWLEDIIRQRAKTDREPVNEIVEEAQQSNRIEINNTKKDTSQAKLEKLFKAFELFRKSTASHEKSNTKPKTGLADNSTTRNIKPYSSGRPYKDGEQNNGSNHNNIKHFSQLLSDLLSNTQIMSTTTSPTTTTEIINLDSISRQIEKILNIKSKSDNNMDYSKTLRRFNNDLNVENNEQIRKTEKTPKENYDRIHIKDDNERLKNNTFKYLNNFLGLNNSLLNTPMTYNSVKSSSSSDLSKYIENKDEMANGKTKTYDNDSIKQLITHDVIKDIAAQVKELVLKDLQKEVTTTTENIQTSKTTEKLINNTPHVQENTQELDKVMQKFMELFQQLKSANASSPLPSTKTSQNYPATEQINGHQAYNIPVKVLIPPILSLQSPYSIRNVPQEMVPILYNHHLNVVTPIPAPLLPRDKNTVNSITQFNVFNNRNDHHPVITMQTNSNEIPPLGISVPKSLNPINQNIIVTTRNPFAPFKRIQNVYTDRNNIYEFKESKNHDRRANFLDFAKRLHPHEGNNHEDYGATDIDDFKMKSYDSNDFLFNTNKVRNNDIRPQNRDQPKHSGHDIYHNEPQQYKPYYRMNQEVRERFQNKDIKGFHERLEKADEWKQDSREYIGNSDCCEIPERQQNPMKDAEYRKYDDTHFQKFLRTQQKVNDMLERVLATKTVSHGPRSVEIP